MREKHLAVDDFGTKISDDDQNIIFRTQRRRVAKLLRTREYFLFKHGKHKRNEIFVISVYSVFR